MPLVANKQLTCYNKFVINLFGMYPTPRRAVNRLIILLRLRVQVPPLGIVYSPICVNHPYKAGRATRSVLFYLTFFGIYVIN